MSNLSTADRTTLLALARAAVEASARGLPLPEPGAFGGALDRPGAAFVSLHRGPDLRGCLGCIEPRPPGLATVVVRMAAAAAHDDPRFPPLAPGELAGTHIEISVLGPLVPIGDPDDIVIGRDGLLVEQEGFRGLLLPQVATEWGWDARRFLEETCRKAGLPRTAWNEGARLFRFEAEVFREAEAAVRAC